MQALASIATAVVILLGFIFLIGFFVTRLYRKVPQGKALLVSTTRAVVVTFTGRIVLPVIHKAEVMDISVKNIEIDRRSTEGLICRDNIRADIKVNFFVRVNKAEQDVVKVAQAIGCERASDPTTLEELFAAKFSEALKTVGKQMDFESLYLERAIFRDRIIEVIGTDLNGYSLEDVAIDYLEQTPLEKLDSTNILDAQGIRKITEMTAIQHVATNVAAREEEKQITAKNVDTKEAVLELERRQADAEARQQREILAVRAREEATTATVQAEERLKYEMATLEVNQKLGIEQENLDREVTVAAKNRERVTAVEQERVDKARELENMSRKVETLSAEKALELEKSTIADIKRERVAVERTVAEEEEKIETLRAVEGADRVRQAAVIEAEASAQGDFVRDIKAAEAAEAASEHLAKEKITLAKASLDASDLEARAEIRLAEGAKASAAAKGLAFVQVDEARADANEKLGLAEVRVDTAKAGAIKELGEAEAARLRTEGLAEAGTIEAKLKGEAAGLIEKASAMKELEDAGQQHEEFIRKLEADTEVRLAKVEAGVNVASVQADAMKAGFEAADIDIVGGSDVFIDRVVGSIGHGKAVDNFFEKSDVAGTAMGPYLNGEKDLLATLTNAVGVLGTDGIRDLTIADLIRRFGGQLGNGSNGLPGGDSADDAK